MSTIEKHSPEQSLTPDNKRLTAMVGSYLYKYALICGREITPELITLYTNALKDIPPHRIFVGLEKWLTDGNRWPWPADIREMAEI
jgi:hypothetical protein